MTDESRLLAGRYRIGELIGRGGMSNVYLGHDERLDREVAIKLLKSSLASDPLFRNRFRQEAHSASRMAHPTIVRVFDAGEEKTTEPDGTETLTPFIVMEHVQGTLLRDLISQGPVEQKEAARIIEGVLTALEYSHRAGVVHRDIKPGNIMITTSGDVKVMDFGIARAIADSSATVAQTSAILGTAQYFSPEQARGDSVDARTDLYSTGVVLFELLTGKAPFRGETPVSVAYQHVSETAVSASSLNSKVSAAFDQVVAHALGKDRFARFQTATDFKKDLATARSGRIPKKRTAEENFNSSLFEKSANFSESAETTLAQLAGDDGQTVKTQSRPPIIWIWAGIGIIAVILVSVLFWVVGLKETNIVPQSSRQIPAVSGQDFDAADATLRQLDLVTQRFDEYSATVPLGQVIRTYPSAGTFVQPTTAIKIYVSLGQKTVTIPDVTGMKTGDADAALKAVDLVVGVTKKENSASAPADTIIRTEPAAGSVHFSGETVILIASNGLVTVPNIINQPIESATNTLSALNLPVKVELNPSCTATPGNPVHTQSIAPGDAPQGSEITITYCTGS